MKKIYYFLALVGAVACTTDPVDVYDGETIYVDDINSATITYDTDTDSSLADKMIQYFGPAYEGRNNLRVTLSGTMESADFADLKSLTYLDMSGVSLKDNTIPSSAFAGCQLDTLILPATGTLYYVADKAFEGTSVSTLNFPSEVKSFGASLFDASSTSLQSLVLTCEEQATVTESSFPDYFTLSYYDDESALDAFLSGVTEADRPSIMVPSGTLYVYRQDATWGVYNIKENTSGLENGYTVIVYSNSQAASVESVEVADLESEIISVAGEDYADIENLDLVIKGSIIESDFSLFASAKFRSIDMSEVDIIGDIAIQDVSETVDTVLYWAGNGIPSNAFSGNSSLESIILPSALEAVGNCSFLSCTSLTSISFPAGEVGSISHLARQAFSKCTSLTTLDFLDGCPLKTIVEYAFGGCTNVVGFNIPASVDSLGMYIINASDVCDYVVVNWTEVDDIPAAYEATPPFPTQFFKGEDEFITIPDNTREIYEEAGWGFFNLCEVSQFVDPKQWILKYEETFDDAATFATDWSHEIGYQRNYELQYYTADAKNSYVQDGKLVVQPCVEENGVLNEFYDATSSDWRLQRESGSYTSASVCSNFNFLYGRVKVRAKLPVSSDMAIWPSVSTFGISDEAWPLTGQVDILTYYSGLYYNRFGCGYTTTQPYWYSKWITFASDEESAAFDNEFHTWLYEWDDETCSIYLYDEDEYGNTTDSTLMVSANVALLVNTAGNTINPYTNNYQYLNFNVALGSNAGTMTSDMFNELYDNPTKYQLEVDYVQVWQNEWQFR